MKSLAIALTLIVSFNAEANNAAKYFTVKSTEVQEIPVGPEDFQLSHGPAARVFGGTNIEVDDPSCRNSEKLTLNNNTGGLDELLGELSIEDLNQVVAIGKQIWKVVEENKPVWEASGVAVSVVPLKLECWKYLTGWKNPVVKRYRQTSKNLFGITVVDFQFKVIYMYGGNYKGRGKYLARVAMLPETLDVAWGYKFNAVASIPTVANYGTLESPVAGVELQLDWSIDTILKHHQSTVNVLVKGNGESLNL